MTQKIKLGEEEVELNPENLKFSDANLNDYLKTSAATLAYYNEKHAMAQYISGIRDDKAEEVYERKFKEAKENGATEKLANAVASTDADVLEAKKKARASKYHSALLYGYIRALDRANTNAINLGYNIRKEMDKMGLSIKSLDDSGFVSAEKEADEIVSGNKKVESF